MKNHGMTIGSILCVALMAFVFTGAAQAAKESIVLNIPKVI